MEYWTDLYRDSNQVRHWEVREIGNVHHVTSSVSLSSPNLSSRLGSPLIHMDWRRRTLCMKCFPEHPSNAGEFLIYLCMWYQSMVSEHIRTDISDRTFNYPDPRNGAGSGPNAYPFVASAQAHPLRSFGTAKPPTYGAGPNAYAPTAAEQPRRLWEIMPDRLSPGQFRYGFESYLARGWAPSQVSLVLVGETFKGKNVLMRIVRGKTNPRLLLRDYSRSTLYYHL